MLSEQVETRPTLQQGKASVQFQHEDPIVLKALGIDRSGLNDELFHVSTQILKEVIVVEQRPFVGAVEIESENVDARRNGIEVHVRRQLIDGHEVRLIVDCGRCRKAQSVIDPVRLDGDHLLGLLVRIQREQAATGLFVQVPIERVVRASIAHANGHDQARIEHERILAEDIVAAGYLLDRRALVRFEILGSNGFALRLAPFSAGLAALLILMREFDARMNERIEIVDRWHRWRVGECSSFHRSSREWTASMGRRLFEEDEQGGQCDERGGPFEEASRTPLSRSSEPLRQIIRQQSCVRHDNGGC